MTKSELIKLIQTDVTAGGTLPYPAAEKEIERIIDVESRWLYREYRDSTEEQIYVLDRRYFLTDEFKNTRSIILPDCVIGISKLMEITGGQRIWGLNDPDLSFDRIMSADLYLSPWSTDQITYRTVQWSFWDLTKSFNLPEIQHYYNLNDHKLFIKGRNPNHSIFIVAVVKIADEYLYEDPVVIKWFTAKAKKSVARYLSTFNFTLLNGITINTSLLNDEADKELEELKQYINDNNPPDIIYMFN